VFTKIDTIIIKTDGAARGNPGPAGIGAVISDEAGQILEEAAEYIGKATNNVAEYSALILGLKAAAGYEAEGVRIYLDSELLVNQLNGAYKVKNTALKSLHAVAQGMIGQYRQASISHVPRAQNAAADRLANEAIDKYESGGAGIRKVIDLPEQGSLF